MVNSLHYTKGNKPNDYQQAIMSVGGVLADYDSDRKFPVFGFGGRTRDGISHCFPLSDSHDAECNGIEGILEAYYQSKNLSENSKKIKNSLVFFLNFMRNFLEISDFFQGIANVPLGYPTNFASVIEKASDYASTHVSQSGINIFYFLFFFF